MCTLLAVCLSGLEDEIIDDMKRHVYSVKGSDANRSISSNRHVRFEVLSVTSSTHPYIACNNNKNSNQANNNQDKQANNRSNSAAVHDHDGCIVINGKNLYQGEAGCGKILIHNVMDYSFINYVRSVQYWFIYVTHSYDIHTTSTIHGRESIQAALTGSVGNKLLSSNHCKCTEEASTGDNSGNNDSGYVDWEQCVSYWKQALRVVKRVATTKDITRTVGN